LTFNQKKYMEKYYKKNKKKMRENNKEWKKNNPEKVKGNYKKWQEDNPEYMSQYMKNKYMTNLNFNLSQKIRKLICKSLRCNKVDRYWEDLIGYKLSDLFKHLQKTMPLNYDWKDFLQGKLQIDHIIPISAFNFNKPEDYDFQQCWSLKNLRLLPAKENRMKYNKIIRPFQPALKI